MLVFAYRLNDWSSLQSILKILHVLLDEIISNSFYLMFISVTPSVCLSVSVSAWCLITKDHKIYKNVTNLLRVWLLQI